ncbi:type II toxin-antitoxin system VapC family toxin [Limnothrix sp. FACHB-708]|uniref:type II toxin-antitoxin system VapC family toxin n=1 Tax=unclassified Limnothrix TaxID=2632864 RepID=UPI000A5D8D9C|nr:MULTISPECIES: PIN domain-containing protein [unclassified Limnothrix]MBD2159673.1 type II toxin-antitoxin system VapC family toxin [Limnothrix sp. FACHB-1083]MBD2190375.1 type II toxin-antitoxin system VapC family toxin [Limnothrix sp. FACHB-1088]MBD2551751.1 type II toxin-antitoxin system VapC family toxin [Limnothrix sp. FACHB-708]MBD2591284.1 type II toxin-antitoxin system VapC family toxin [Limnothrix sp. FACHB-406]PIB04712.1 twitching motility protein PilT [Limnothrix sp. PR1529]
MKPAKVLVDSGVLIAFYNAEDRYHSRVVDFFRTCRSELITTLACVTEVLWLLNKSWQVQNIFLNHLAQNIYRCESLNRHDFQRIVELNEQYSDLPGDFADLALVAISERLRIAEIATLDQDFDVYRRYRKEPFIRVFRP